MAGDILSIVLTGTTDSGGALTVDADFAARGLIYAVQWIDGSFDDGVGAVLSCQNFGGQGVAFTILTLTNANNDALYHLLVPASDETGAALTIGTDPVSAPQFFDGKLRLVVSSGGNTKTGGCIVYYYNRG